MPNSNSSQSNVNLWPTEIRPQQFLSPKEILENLGRQLVNQMNGLLVGETIEDDLTDRRVLRFDVVSVKEDTRVKIFELHHRKEQAYPVAVVPPDQELPEFLSSEVYRPGIADAMQAMSQTTISHMLAMKGRWEKNEWIASTPLELNNLLRMILEMPVVKATVVSLLSEVDQESRVETEDTD